MNQIQFGVTLSVKCPKTRIGIQSSHPLLSTLSTCLIAMRTHNIQYLAINNEYLRITNKHLLRDEMANMKNHPPQIPQ